MPHCTSFVLSLTSTLPKSEAKGLHFVYIDLFGGGLLEGFGELQIFRSKKRCLNDKSFYICNASRLTSQPNSQCRLALIEYHFIDINRYFHAFD